MSLLTTSSAAAAGVAHAFSAVSSACMIVLVALESPVGDASSIVLLIFFSLLIIGDAFEYSVWYTGAWDRWRDAAVKAKSVVGIAVLGRDPFEPLPVKDAAQMEVYAEAEELALYVGLAVSWTIVTVFFGTDAAPAVRNVNGGVAATLATFCALAMVAWASRAHVAMRYHLSIDVFWASCAGVALGGVALSDQQMPQLEFTLSWVCAAGLGGAAIRCAVVAASGLWNSQPSWRRAGPFVLVGAQILIWGVLLGAAGYAIFNPGLFVSAGILTAFCAYELFVSGFAAFSAASAAYLGREEQEEKDAESQKTAVAAIHNPFASEPVPTPAIFGLWAATRVLVLALGLASVWANAPAAVGWVLWVFCAGDAALTFWGLFRDPARPKYAAASCLSAVVLGACVCAPPVPGNQTWAGPIVMLFLWLLVLLASFVPDLVDPPHAVSAYETLAQITRNVTPASRPRHFARLVSSWVDVKDCEREALEEFPNHSTRAFKYLLVKRAADEFREDEAPTDLVLVASCALGVSFLSGFVGFVVACLTGRPVLSQLTAAFAAILTWTIVQALMAIVATIVLTQRLSASLSLENIVQRGPSPEKKDD